MLRYRKETEKYASEDVQCILVATKADLDNKRLVTEDEGQVIFYHLIISLFQKLADSWNARFAEVSAKTGDNVEDSFLSFLKDLHEHMDSILPDPKQQTPKQTSSTTKSSWWSSPFKWFGLS